MRPHWHPDVSQLTDFGLGKLGDAESRAVEAHLVSCAICLERIVETGASDEFIDQLRRIHGEKRDGTFGTQP